jgi:hypothetical protein
MTRILTEFDHGDSQWRVREMAGSVSSAQSVEFAMYLGAVGPKSASVLNRRVRRQRV